MARRILDTNVLIHQWRRKKGRGPRSPKEKDVEKWAQELIRIHESNWIVTPVRLEVLAGVNSSNELQLTQVFLDQFICKDDETILGEDWQEAMKLAQRVPKDGKARDSIDCLIRALARRLRCEAVTADRRFPR